MVWASVLSLWVVLLLNGRNSADLDDGTQVILGIAIGGTVAAWTLLGSWSILIHLPVEEDASTPGRARGERIGPRVVVLAVVLLQIVLFAFGLGEGLPILVEIVPPAALGVAGAMLVFQWTRQRIHRGMLVEKNQPSIRQILGATTTVALSLALIKAFENWFDVSTHLLIMIAISSIFWLLMLLLSLGRWWWLSLATLPIAGLVWGIGTVTVDLESRDVEALWMRSTGFVIGFYFLAMTLLLLMRSSGHRWFANRRFVGENSTPRRGDETNIDR